MNHERQRLQDALEKLQAELDELENVEPRFRERLEHTLAEVREALAETSSSPGGLEQPGVVQRLTESARHFEETHPNLSGMIGSVIDALGRMGI